MNAKAQGRTPMSAETARLIRNWIIQSAAGLVVIGAGLLVGAGRWTWTWGWIQIAILTAFLAAHPLLLIPLNPELLAERQRGLRAEGTKPWDRLLVALAGGMMYPMLVVGALDERFGWTAAMPLSLHLLGTLGCLLGYGIFLWAMVSNAYFAEGVRIQTERGHRVATRGPYRWVRHPAYAGDILAALATPFMLGSIWALIPALLMGLLFGIRTALEDRTLQAELEGYQAYAERVRYRLIPGVW